MHIQGHGQFNTWSWHAVVFNPFWNICVTMVARLVIVHWERPFVPKLLTSELMSWDPALIYPHRLPSPWCNWFCKVHHSLQLKSSPTIWCGHFCASRLRWCILAWTNQVLGCFFVFFLTRKWDSCSKLKRRSFVLKQHLPSYCPTDWPPVSVWDLFMWL